MIDQKKDIDKILESCQRLCAENSEDLLEYSLVDFSSENIKEIIKELKSRSGDFEVIYSFSENYEGGYSVSVFVDPFSVYNPVSNIFKLKEKAEYKNNVYHVDFRNRKVLEIS